MKEKWILMTKKADFYGIAERFGIDPVIARVIRNRDITGDEAIHEYLYGGLEKLKDPLVLKDMDRASELLKQKIEEKKKIRIIGDYDVDGIMSSFILKSGILEAGGDADIRIPNRVYDGYGLNCSMIESAKCDGVDTIVTCDNGVSAGEAVSLAKSYGMTVIVTDHHEVSQLPPADAVVDPKREDDFSDSGILCGASVAWKLVRAIGGDAQYELLQYAAFATVCDIVDLKGENRIIVREGLRRLRTSDNTGLQSLSEVCSVSLPAVNTYQLGFLLGPCLNASGRLDSAMKALSLLESRNQGTAMQIAEELKALNDSRKSMTEAGVNHAIEMIEAEGYTKDRVMVLFLPDLHESIAGIIAGRLREKYSRPVFVLTRAENAVKGSGRSIPRYSMYEELTKVSSLLVKFGGHPMAAGLSLCEENIPILRKQLNENTDLTGTDLIPEVKIDVPMPVSYVTESLIGQLELLEPCGKGNEKPLFAQKHVFCDHVRLLGARHQILKMRIRSLAVPGDADPDRPGFQPIPEGPEFDAISFRNVDDLAERIAASPELSIVYEPQINEYMGQRRIQILIHHYE